MQLRGQSVRVRRVARLISLSYLRIDSQLDSPQSVCVYTRESVVGSLTVEHHQYDVHLTHRHIIISSTVQYLC